MSLCRVVLQVEGQAVSIHDRVRVMIETLKAAGVTVHAARLSVDLGGEYDLLGEAQAVKEGGVIVDGSVVYPA